MICPHCGIGFHNKPDWKNLGTDHRGFWFVDAPLCPECKMGSFTLECREYFNTPEGRRYTVKINQLVYPHRISSRGLAPPEVPPEIGEDYNEACRVVADSQKASAALSRRCLQNILRDAAKVKHADLFDEIQEVLNRGTLPSQIAESIDAVRVIGNFATHPTKSKSAGTLVDVEPHEAEWNLDVLELLFDFYYVSPAKNKAKIDALNKKLADAGKPPIR